MTSFDSSGLEISSHTKHQAENLDEKKVHIRTDGLILRLLAAVFGIGSVVSLFLPWVTIELPMNGNSTEIYPWVFIGGRAFTFVYLFLVVAGFVLVVTGNARGFLFVAVPAATISWFALLIAVISSIFHNFFGIFGALIKAAMVFDTGDSGTWIRQGHGLILAIVCGFGLGVIALLHFEPLCRTIWVAKNFYTSILAIASLVVLLASSQSTWVFASVSGRDLWLRVQGDQIFGSAIIDALIWMTLGIWVLYLLCGFGGLQKAAQIMTVVAAILRLLQCGFVLVGASFFESAVPRSVPIGQDVDRLLALYLTVGLSVVLVPLVFSSGFPQQVRVLFWGLICVFLSGALIFVVLSDNTRVGGQGTNTVQAELFTTASATSVLITPTSAPPTTVPMLSSTSSSPVPPGDFFATITFIETASESAVRSAFDKEFGLEPPPLDWTGSVEDCDPGTTNRVHQEATLSRVNWYRAMAGVEPSVTLNDQYTIYAQAAALTMLASDQLSHEPDSSFNCLTEWSYMGASNSNLYLGSRGPDSIDGYVEDEGENNTSVGHRRWILLPELLEIGTGDTTGSNALFVLGDKENLNAKTREDGFVMWPPRGYVPRSTIYPRWSISAEKALYGKAHVLVRNQTRVLYDDSVWPDRSIGWPTLVFSIPTSSLGKGPIDVEIYEDNNGRPGVLVTRYQVTPIG